MHTVTPRLSSETIFKIIAFFFLLLPRAYIVRPKACHRCVRNKIRRRRRWRRPEASKIGARSPRAEGARVTSSASREKPTRPFSTRSIFWGMASCRGRRACRSRGERMAQRSTSSLNDGDIIHDRRRIVAARARRRHAIYDAYVVERRVACFSMAHRRRQCHRARKIKISTLTRAHEKVTWRQPARHHHHLRACLPSAACARAALPGRAPSRREENNRQLFAAIWRTTASGARWRAALKRNGAEAACAAPRSSRLQEDVSRSAYRPDRHLRFAADNPPGDVASCRALRGVIGAHRGNACSARRRGLSFLFRKWRLAALGDLGNRNQGQAESSGGAARAGDARRFSTRANVIIMCGGGRRPGAILKGLDRRSTRQ